MHKLQLLVEPRCAHVLCPSSSSSLCCSSDLEGWMKTLQKILNMQDASCYSPLKGLPRQKAMRKGQRSPTTPEPHTSPPLPLSSADSVEDSHGASSSLEKVKDVHLINPLINSFILSRGVSGHTSPPSLEFTLSLATIDN